MKPMRARSRVERTLSAVFGVALLAFGVGAHASNGDATVPGEILVELGTSSALPPLLQKYGLAVVGQFGSRPIFRLKTTGTADVPGTIAGLQQETSVVVAEPNFAHRSPEARKNVVWAIGSPQAYVAQWAPPAIHLDEAQQLSTGQGVRVAVLDTGIDRSHPALAGRLLPGFDFVDFDSDPSEVGTVGDAGFGHGTHVAGLVALVAPSARIMPIRVLDAQGEGNAWVLLEAMLRAVDPDGNPATDDGAHVINMSLGSLSRTRIVDTISTLVSCSLPAVDDPNADFTDAGYDDDKLRCSHSAGAVIVAAAGNGASDAERQYPAAEGAYGLLPIAASAANDRLATFSNYGSWVEVAAPGDGITSTVPGGRYATWSGTSMATPIAAGVAALLRAREPQLSAVDVVKRMSRFTRALCDASQRQIDAAAALQSRAPIDPSCPR